MEARDLDGRDQKKQFELVIETIPDGVAIFDSAGNITFANPAAERILGLTRGDIAGLAYNAPQLKIMTVEGTPFPSERLPFAEVMRNGKPVYGVEFSIERPDGERIVLSVNTAPLRDDRGAIVGAVATFTDVTARKTGELDLKESERRFREMLEEIDLVAVVLNEEGKIVFANEFLLDLTGWRWEEVAGKDWFDTFVPADQREQLRRGFFESLAKGTIFPHFENDIVTSYGERRTIFFTNVILRGARGNVIGTASIGQDITDQKRAAREIKESRRQVLDILESITDGFFALDNDWRFTYVNRKAEHVLGKKREDLLFRNIWDVFPELAASKCHDKYQHAKREMAPVSFVEFCQPMDKWLETHVYPYENGLSIYLRDVTERRKTENALKESEERYRRLVDLSPDGIAVHSGGKLVYVNEATVKMFGAESADELIGKSVLDFVHPDDRERVVERIKRMQQGETVGLVEERFVRIDGTPINVEVAASPITYRGKPAVQVVFRDVTERRKALRASAQMEENYRAIFNSANDSIFVQDIQTGAILDANYKATEMFGFAPEEMRRLTVGDLSASAEGFTQDEAMRLIHRVAEGEPQLFEWLSKKKNGDVFWSEVNLRKALIGGEERLLAVVRDVSERKRLEEERAELARRMHLLLESTDEGIYGLDTDARAFLVNKAATEITGYTAEELLSGNIHQLIHHTKPDGSPYPVEECPVVRATRVGQGVRIDTDVFWRRDGTSYPVEYSSYPIVEKGEIKGAVVTFTDITERKSAERLNNALNSINAIISSTLDVNTIMQRVVIAAVKAIGVETAGIVMREDDEWVYKYLYNYPQEFIGTPLSQDAVRNLEVVAAERGPVVSNQAYRDQRFDREFMMRYRLRSFLGVPLTIREEVIGILFFANQSEVAPFTQSQVDFASKLAVSTSLALENARLYAIERHIADTLQEALLTVPQQIPGIEFGHLYRSATEATKVGGDFYDLFEIEHGKVGIVVGDVSGKGLSAASLTSLVKNTIKAYAYQDVSPASIMQKTNEVVRKAAEPSSFITVFFGILDLSTGRLTYCSAGHPPGILKKSTSEVEVLITSSPIVGAFSELSFIDDEAVIERGDVLLLYTDGVIEARCPDHGFFGEERLLDFIRDLRPTPASDLPRVLFDEIMICTVGKLSDDVALLAVGLPNQRTGG